MAPLSSIWSDLLKKKTSKVVRYNHPSEAQVRRPIAASFQ
jgi:hypothetical protein